MRSQTSHPHQSQTYQLVMKCWLGVEKTQATEQAWVQAPSPLGDVAKPRQSSYPPHRIWPLLWFPVFNIRGRDHNLKPFRIPRQQRVLCRGAHLSIL